MMTNDELIDRLRRAASIWFKNDDLLLLEELIRRYRNLQHWREVDAKPDSPSVK